MTPEAINEIVNKGMSQFISKGVMDWRHPEVPEVLARLRTCTILKRDNVFNASDETILAIYFDNLKLSTPEVAQIIERLDRIAAVENGPDGPRLHHLRAELQRLERTPHMHRREEHLREVRATIANLTA